MKITPIDIQQVEFRNRVRGYDRHQVDQFLEEVAETVETLVRENTTLRERLAVAEQQLGELKKTEATLTNTLISTQSLAEELKHAAHRDAELIMKEAELKASEMLREARVEWTNARRDITEVRKQRLLAIERLRSTLRTFERILEIEERDEDSAVSLDATEKVAERSNL
jgi:cell division initiation protein